MVKLGTGDTVSQTCHLCSSLVPVFTKEENAGLLASWDSLGPLRARTPHHPTGESMALLQGILPSGEWNPTTCKPAERCNGLPCEMVTPVAEDA